MSGIRAILVSALPVLMGLAIASAALPSQQKTVHKHAAKPAPAAEVPPPPPPPGPLVPFTLEQTPATPPQVAYHDGILTIGAQNSTLADILRAVHTQTGAIIDVSGNATERVVGEFGPGPAREVMAMLLNGSHFNYVMLGSTSDASILERLVLTPKPPPTAEAAVQRNATMNAYGRGRGRDFDNSDQDDDNDSDVQPGPVQPEDQQQPDSSSQPPIKTPEQLLQELQRQQQIQQQQQQQQAQPQNTPIAPRQR